MTKRSNKGGEIDVIRASMNELLSEADTTLQKTSRAFRHSRLEGIRGLNQSSSWASITGGGLINSVLELSHADDAEKKALINAIGHLERICACSSELAARVRAKIERDILFSIQAYGECNELFAESLGTISALSQLLGGDIELTTVEGLCGELEQRIYGSGRRHEERLVKGICAIKASDIFIDMLDLFREIAFHSSKAASSLKREMAD